MKFRKSTIIFECGCSIPSEKRIKIHKGEEKVYGQIVCRKHDAKPNEFWFVCPECGKIEQTTSLSSLIKRKKCRECLKKGILKNAGKRYKNADKRRILYFPCGCVYYKRDLQGNGKAGRSVRLYRCPNHNTLVRDVMLKCEICGNEFPFKRFSTAKCPDCKRKAKEDAQSGGVNLNYNKDAAATYDCVHRDKCLIENMNKQSLPCRGCDKYQKWEEII